MHKSVRFEIIWFQESCNLISWVHLQYPFADLIKECFDCDLKTRFSPGMQLLQNNENDHNTLCEAEKDQYTWFLAILTYVGDIFRLFLQNHFFFFLKNPTMRVFYPEDILTSCAVSEKHYEPFWRKYDYWMTYWMTDWHWWFPRNSFCLKVGIKKLT